jgi:hypothetical protein
MSERIREKERVVAFFVEKADGGEGSRAISDDNKLF